MERLLAFFLDVFEGLEGGQSPGTQREKKGEKNSVSKLLLLTANLRVVGGLFQADLASASPHQTTDQPGTTAPKL